jgi:hypothetical protein
MSDCCTTVMLSAFVTVCCGEPESAACTVKLEVPLVVGVPVIAPLAAKESPEGSVPTVTDQFIGVTPPVDCRVEL